MQALQKMIQFCSFSLGIKLKFFMQRYINMNDSFGGKHSISTTKSFHTSYEECIQSLTLQLDNHKQALQTAGKLVDQYKEQNQKLLEDIQKLIEGKARSEQKYEVLEKLFIKLDKAKQKEIDKEQKRSQEKYKMQVDSLNSRYEKHISMLNERIFWLQTELNKHQEKQNAYQERIKQLQKQIHKFEQRQKASNEQLQMYKFQQRIAEKLQKTDKKQKNELEDSLQIVHISKKPSETRSGSKPSASVSLKTSQTKYSCGKDSIADQKKVSTRKYESHNQTPQRQSTPIKKQLFQKASIHNPCNFMRIATEVDYMSQKQHLLNTISKKRPLFLYEGSMTEQKRRY